MMTVRRPARRAVTGLVVAALVGGSAIGAEAATKKKPAKPKKVTRTVVLKYTGGCTIDLSAGGQSAAAAPGACTTVGAGDWAQSALPKEKYLSITVADASGRAVPGQVWIKGTAVGQDTAVPFCGSMKNYLMAASDFTLDVDAVGAVASCPGTATTGTVTLVYSNLP